MRTNVTKSLDDGEILKQEVNLTSHFGNIVIALLFITHAVVPS